VSVVLGFECQQDVEDVSCKCKCMVVTQDSNYISTIKSTTQAFVKLIKSKITNILMPIQLCRVSTEEVRSVCTSRLPHHYFTEAYITLASNFVKIYHPVSNVLSIKRPVTLQVADIHTSFIWKMDFKYFKMTDNIFEAVYYVEIGLFVVIILYNLYMKKFMSVPCMIPDIRTIQQHVSSFHICNTALLETLTFLRCFLVFLLLMQSDVLLEQCLMRGTRHFKIAKKKTNMKLFHTIQIVFKYELATSLAFSLQTDYTKIQHTYDIQLQQFLMIHYKDCDLVSLCLTIHTHNERNVEYSLFNVTAGQTVQQRFLYILFYNQFIYILNSKPGYLSTILK
jgi:hypothetical protein